MIYGNYIIGGELYHAEKGTSGIKAKVHKYIDKIRTKTGKWRYIYDTKVTGKLYKMQAQGHRNAAAKHADEEIRAKAVLKRDKDINDKYLNEKSINRLESMIKSGNAEAEKAARNAYKSGKFYFNRDNPNEKETNYKRYVAPKERRVTSARQNRARNLASAREATENYNKSIAGRLDKAIKNLKKKKKK